MRAHFSAADSAVAEVHLRSDFAKLGESLQMNWQLNDAANKPRAMLMVSKIGHCLNDFRGVDVCQEFIDCTVLGSATAVPVIGGIRGQSATAFVTDLAFQSCPVDFVQSM